MNDILLVFSICVLLNVTGCNRDRGHGFGVYNTSGSDITNVVIAIPGGDTWPLGVVGSTGIKTIGLPGPVPDSADLTWTDAANVVHKQHLKITPLPPPTATSYSGVFRDVYFQINPDGTAKVVYHDPYFNG